MDSILAQHQTVFQEDLGTLVGYKAQIQVDPTATSNFAKPKQCHMLLDLVNKELDRLVEQGILSPVPFADWVAPIVPVLKVSKVDKYPIPKIEDLFAMLSGGKSFTTEKSVIFSPPGDMFGLLY